MSAAVQQGVILAAGRGSRLMPLSDVYPKPLQPICNKPIMQYQVEVMRAAGITDLCIVIGARGAPIADYFGDGAQFGMRITYIEDTAPAGIASSLAKTERWVRGPFAVFLGDIFLAIDDLASALAPLEAGAAGTVVTRPDTLTAVRQNFAVLTQPDGRITRVVEKPPDPETNLKGCGVYVFSEQIFEAIRRTPRSALRNEYEITDAVQVLIDMGPPVYAANVVRWDINITYPSDLLACNLRMLHEQQVGSLIGVGACVGVTTRLNSSIVGDRAVVDGAVLLDECLVLPDVAVTDLQGTMRRRIFAQGLPSTGLVLQ